MQKKDIKINNDTISTVHHKADSDKWIFLCHGFGGNKDRGNKERAKFLNENGWNAVRFDFRGNGESTGDFKEQNLSSRIKDLQTVVENFNPDRFVIFGTSFGGKVAFHSIERLENVAGVIGKAPVTYNEIMNPFRNVVEEKGEFEYIDNKPVDKRFFEDLDDYNFDKLEGLEIPVCIFHGRKDTTVHIENTFQAIELFDNECMLYAFKDEKHSFSDEGKRKMNPAMLEWLEDIF